MVPAAMITNNGTKRANSTAAAPAFSPDLRILGIEFSARRKFTGVPLSHCTKATVLLPPSAKAVAATGNVVAAVRIRARYSGKSVCTVTCIAKPLPRGDETIVGVTIALSLVSPFNAAMLRAAFIAMGVARVGSGDMLMKL